MKALQIVEPGTQYPWRHPEGTVKRTQNPVVSTQAQQIKPQGGDPAHGCDLAARKEDALGHGRGSSSGLERGIGAAR